MTFMFCPNGPQRWNPDFFYSQWGIKYNCVVFSLISHGPTWVRKHLMDGQCGHAVTN